MAISNKYRWVMVGELVIRKPKNAGTNAPLFNLDDVLSAAEKILSDNNQYRAYGVNKSQLMWWDNFTEKDDFKVLIANVGDKETSGISFIDFEEKSSRDVKKEEDEGAHYTGHIIIQKTPIFSGNEYHHLILAERVPSISVTSLKNHLSWIFNQFDEFIKDYVDANGQDKKAKPVFDLLGYQASTLKEALKTGTFQDIEFVKHEEVEDLDENTIIQSKIHEAKWDIRKKVNEEQAKSVLNKAVTFIKEKFTDDNEEARMFVRIKSSSGQIKRTEVKQNKEILEQVFLLNERIHNFSNPLPPRYKEINNEVRDKIIAKAVDLSATSEEENEDEE